MSAAKLWLALGALYGLLGVALGAFGAHALKARLTGELLPIWKTAVEYHFWHALALVLVGVLALQRPGAALNVAGGAFALGVLIFSGSLYALALSGVRGLGAVTPIGGVLLIVGWAALLWAAVTSRG
jgi:uncharacterized membrane protein YgdD (TMEM256/DUF423 family)